MGTNFNPQIATKDKLVGKQTVRVVINVLTKIPDLTIKEPVAGATDTSGMSNKDIEARNKLMTAMKTEFEALVRRLVEGQ